MTIDKAIEILQHRKKPGDYIEPVEEEDLDKAILPGIEALKRIMRHSNIATTQKYVNLAMRSVIEHHHQYSPLRDAIRGSQGVLWREVEEILEKS